MNKENNQTISIGLILGWGLGILFLVSGISTIFSEFLSGLLLIIMAVVMLPPVNKFFADKYKIQLSKSLKILLILICLIAFGVVMEKSNTTKQELATPVAEEVEEVIGISATKLYQQYEDNEISADNLYKNKVLRVEGVVGNIGNDILDNPYVALKTNNVIGSVQCMLKNSHKSAAAQFRKGESIIVKGENAGKMMNVILNDCIIIM